MLPYLIKFKEIALDILFPRICLNCEKHLDGENGFICNACFSSIKINSAFFCPVCRGRLPDMEKICHPKSRFFLAPAGEYSDPILQKIIQSLKYQGIKNLAPVLGEFLIKYLNSLNPQCSMLNSIIIPIPLHKSRERQRGFNQAKLMAEYVAGHFNLPLVEGLKRIKKTESQAKMKNKGERLKNISGCFKVVNPESVKEKNVILIDDVFTTGDTISEAVKILKENRCGKIIALVAAKA